MFFTPSADIESTDLCSELQKLFGVKNEGPGGQRCTTANEKAIKMPMLSERFTMSTAFQYYTPFFNDDWAASTISGYVRGETGAHSPAHFDIDYDAISQTVVFTVLDSSPSEGWREDIRLGGSGDSTKEIGVLAHEPNTDPEDIQFGGFLTVLGRDDKPSTSSIHLAPHH